MHTYLACADENGAAFAKRTVSGLEAGQNLLDIRNLKTLAQSHTFVQEPDALRSFTLTI
jgi:hypothetical protein